MRKARLAVFAVAIAGGAAACFPAFDFGDGASGDGGTPNTLPDATVDQASPADANDTPDSPGPADADGGAVDGAKDALTDGATPYVPFDASDMIYIEAGTFQFNNYGNGVTATLSRDFLVDKYETTVARFAAWIAAGQSPPCPGTCSLDPNGPYKNAMVWQETWNISVGGSSYTVDSTCNPAGNASGLVPDWAIDGGASFPVSCVNWYQAASFCAFEGKRLLTETEWAYVASGRGAGRAYPWGNAPPGAGCDYAIWSFVDAGENDCRWPVNVGSASKGATIDGVLDMSGSVFEWVWDWYEPTGMYTGGVDYAGFPEDGGSRVDRGGSWAADESELTTSNRDTTGPTYNFEDVGIRCARSL
jgi:sulfatase modifying factor 1